MTPPDGDDAERSPAPPVEPARGGVPAEVETDGKVVVAGLRNGRAAVIDLSSKRVVAELAPSSAASALWAIDYSSASGQIATGAADGVVSIFDLRHTASPLVSWCRTPDSRVNALSFSTLQPGSLLVGGLDGQPYRATFGGDAAAGPEVVVVEEYAGLDTDSVGAIVERPGGVFAASDDGHVRRW